MLTFASRLRKNGQFIEVLREKNRGKNKQEKESL